MKNVMLNEKQYDLFKKLMLEDLEYDEESEFDDKPNPKLAEYANELERRNTFEITEQGHDYIKMASEEVIFEIRMDNDTSFGEEPKPYLTNIRIPLRTRSQYTLDQVKNEINFLLDFFNERHYN